MKTTLPLSFDQLLAYLRETCEHSQAFLVDESSAHNEIVLRLEVDGVDSPIRLVIDAWDPLKMRLRATAEIHL